MRAPRIIILAVYAAMLPAQAADLSPGQTLAATCANCHGTDGKSAGTVASLAGMPADTLLQRIAEFKEGSRPATIMHQIAKGYTDEQMRQIADYFAARK